MVCKNCGKELDETYYCCPACGAKVEREDDTKPKNVTKNGRIVCKNCGKDLDETYYCCPACGAKVERESAPQQGSASRKDGDSGSAAGYGFLSFLFPIVGLILFIVWKEDRPKTASTCGVCALISFLLGVVGSIILFSITASAVYGAEILPVVF